MDKIFITNDGSLRSLEFDGLELEKTWIENTSSMFT